MKTQPGICSVCACTHDDPCFEGCGWHDRQHTICTACAPLSAADREAKRVQALEGLAMQLEIAKDAVLELTARCAVLDQPPTSGAKPKPGRTRKSSQQPRYSKAVRK